MKKLFQNHYFIQKLFHFNMSPNGCLTLPGPNTFYSMIQSKAAQELHKHLLLKGEHFELDTVSSLVSRLKGEMKRSAIAHGLSKCIAAFVQSIGMVNVKENILSLIKMCPESCVENCIGYFPLYHLLAQPYSTPDKEILVALLETCPKCALKPNAGEGMSGVTPLHIHLMGVEPDFVTVMTVLRYCPAAARCELGCGKLSLHLIVSCDAPFEHFPYMTYLHAIFTLLHLYPAGAFKYITETVTKFRVVAAPEHFSQEAEAYSTTTSEPFSVSSNTDAGNNAADAADVSGVSDVSDVSFVSAVADESVQSERTETDDDDSSDGSDDSVGEQASGSVASSTPTPPQQQQPGSDNRAATITVVERTTVRWCPIEKLLESKDEKVRAVATIFLENLAFKTLRAQWRRRKY